MTRYLFTGYDQTFAPLAKLTVPLMHDYAKRHGYHFDCVTSHPPIPNGQYWVGVMNAVVALRHFDQVMYLDADQIITNPDVIFDFNHGFHVSRDWGVDAGPIDFSMCGFIAHPDCIPLFLECMNLEPEWRDKPFPEQGPMRYLIAKKFENLMMVPNVEGLQGFLNIHPRRVFNAVPIEVHPSVVDPWQPGDFAAHATMLPLEDRIKLFHKIHG